MSPADPVAFPADLADPDQVAVPVFPDGPSFPRAVPVVPAVRPCVPADLVAPVGPAARVDRVAPADPVAAGLVAPAARAALRDPTTAARPLLRPRCGWPRRRGVAPPA